MADLQLLFLGTGTSAGVPMIGCHCPVCTSTDPHDRRTRCSVVFSYHNINVLVDTTPELRLQSLATGLEAIEAVVITHAHADHIMGLDDVRRFNTLRGGPLDVWAEAPTLEKLRCSFDYAFRAPDPDQKVYRPHLQPQIISGDFSVAGATWQPIRLFHGELPILGFRVGSIAYCTDVNRIPDSSWALLHDLDVLIIDGLQWKTHSTHFSLTQAIEAARRINARQTYFTHIAHAVGHEQTNRQLPPNMQLAYDGLRVCGQLPD